MEYTFYVIASISRDFFSAPDDALREGAITSSGADFFTGDILGGNKMKKISIDVLRAIEMCSPEEFEERGELLLYGDWVVGKIIRRGSDAFVSGKTIEGEKIRAENLRNNGWGFLPRGDR